MIKAGELLRSARRRAGLTQRELARRAKVPQPTIAAIEAGRQEPRYGTLARLLRAAGFEVDYYAIAGQGVDPTLARENLRASPAERLRRVAAGAQLIATLRAARRV
jgi:transcriptional regulator with XRE-family HTH domain